MYCKFITERNKLTEKYISYPFGNYCCLSLFSSTKYLLYIDFCRVYILGIDV